MATLHRDEALKALEHAIERLASPEPLDGLSTALLKGALEHAREQVKQIHEVKRVRKAAPVPA